MKKLGILAVALMVSMVASADMYEYTFAGVSGSAVEFAPGDGAGYLVDLVNTAADTTFDSTSVVANNAGQLFILGWKVAAPGIEELTDVKYRIYNAADVASASHYMDSAIFNLQAVSLPVGATALNVDQSAELSFAAQPWVAIPEPATLGLMGIAGLGMFLARKKARR